MNRTLPILLALVTFGVEIPSPTRAATSGVRDRAGMFSKAAVDETNAYLRSIERETGWQVIIETIPSLEGKPIEDAALAGAKASQVHGLYILISKGDHKLWIEPSRSAQEIFTKDKLRRLSRRMETTFHAHEYDEGLFRAAAEIRDDIVRSKPAPASTGAPAGAATGVPARTTPIPVPIPEEKNGRNTRRIGESTPGPVGLVLICVGVLLFFWLIGKIIRRVIHYVGGPTPGPAGAPYPTPGAGSGVPVGPQPGPGYGTVPRPGPPVGPPPNYGPPSYPAGPGYAVPPQPPPQGGGFVSGALGGLGGAVLGNILYDKFGRPHPGPEMPQGGAGALPPSHHDQGGVVEPAPESSQPLPPAENYDPNAGAGGDWGTPEPETPTTPPDGDWSGGDGGGDWGSAEAPSPENDAGAGGDWGNVEEAPADDQDGGAGGDWDAPDAGGDDQGGSW